MSIAPPEFITRRDANTAFLVNPKIALDQIIVRGSHLRYEVQEAVTEATFAAGTDAVTEISLTLEDPGLAIANSGQFTLKTLVVYRQPTHDLRLVISAVEVNGGEAGTGGMQITCRSEGVQRLKDRQGPHSMPNVSPSQFVEAECKAVGLKVVVQPSASRVQIARDVPKEGETPGAGAQKPSSWTTFLRLAQEVGYYVFEHAGTVYFGQPSWLMKREIETVKVAWQIGGYDSPFMAQEAPVVRQSLDSEIPVEISDVKIRRERIPEVAPGKVLELRGGMGPFIGKYLISSVAYSLLGTDPVTLTASTPIDPVPDPPDDSGSTTAQRGVGEWAFIVEAAHAAGWRGDDLIMAVAVALAESGGKRDAINRNSNGSTDYGLWQINSVHNPSVPGIYDPLTNAKYAYRIWSEAGRRFSGAPPNGGPWYAHRDGKHLKHMAAAKASVETRSVAGAVAGSAAVQQGTKSALDFVNIAMSQAGDPYIWGGKGASGNPNPHGFDCSGLIQWAAARAGVSFPHGSVNQAAAMNPIPLEKAFATRGALLFRPTPGGGRPNHIGISLGNGQSMEARSTKSGVGVFNARDIPWTRGGLIPGLKYG